MEYVPAPDVTLAAPIRVAPFKKNEMVPVGVPAPGAVTASVVEIVIVWPTISVPVALGVVKLVAACVAVVVSVTTGAAPKVASPAWEKVTVQVPVGLVMVMVADPDEP